MGLFRIKKLRLTSDKCAEELFNVVFWVQSYFKSALIEDNEELDEIQLVQLVSDRSYEMLLLSLWVMHTYLPSETLRDKICKLFLNSDLTSQTPGKKLVFFRSNLNNSG